MQIVPDGRLTLPVRMDFQQLHQLRSEEQPRQRPTPAGAEGGAVYNIGQVYLRSKIPLWFTLADVLAGVIRDGARLTIVRAVAFVPSREKVETHTREIAEVLIDPSRDIVGTKLIDLRRTVKQRAAQARADGNLPLALQLDGQQNALKEIALAGGYGTAEELNEKVYEGQRSPWRSMRWSHDATAKSLRSQGPISQERWAR